MSHQEMYFHLIKHIAPCVHPTDLFLSLTFFDVLICFVASFVTTSSTCFPLPNGHLLSKLSIKLSSIWFPWRLPLRLKLSLRQLALVLEFFAPTTICTPLSCVLFAPLIWQLVCASVNKLAKSIREQCPASFLIVLPPSRPDSQLVATILYLLNTVPLLENILYRRWVGPWSG